MSVSQNDIERDCELGRAAHRRLLDRLDALVEAGQFEASAPSRLGGWTHAMLVTHLARNADGHRRMIEGAAIGEIREQYEGGVEARRAGIEAGRGRSARAVLADLRESTERLEVAWSETDWIGSGTRTLTTTSHTPIAELPFRRLREVELHHVDLGIGYEFADLDRTYVRLEVRRLEMLWTARQPMGMSSVPAGALALDPHERVAWLTGRLEVDGVRPAQLF